MERDQTIVEATFLSLPTELIVIVISFLSSRDRAKLRYVSQRLRNASETPSLWREFVWEYYDTSEELCVMNMLQRCGEHIKRLAFPGYLTPKLGDMLQYCNNVTHVSLPVVMKLSPDQLTQLGEAARHMKHLHTLDICWDADNITPILLIGSNLKELTLYTGLQFRSFSVWVNEWVLDMGFRPANLNMVSFTDVFTSQKTIQDLVNNWQQWNSKVPVGCTANFRVYKHNIRLNIYPIVPTFQLHFGQMADLPFVQAKQCDIHGLDCLQLTDCCRDGKVVYKASTTSLHSPQLNSTITSLCFLTHFKVAGCTLFLPSHLEHLAISCPNLQQLVLNNCTQCLSSLQGLRAIASHCHNLRELDLLRISVSEIESQIQLWEILSRLRLTHLSAKYCVVCPCVAEYKEKMMCLYEKCSSLVGLCTGSFSSSCRSCNDLSDKDLLFLCLFPSLKCLKVSNGQYLPLVQDIITSCKELKCFRVFGPFLRTPPPLSFACNNNLQQLCIESRNVDVLDSFMISVSAHGGLVHVFLSVASASVEGINVLIENSPKLITFYSILELRFVRKCEEEFVKLEHALRQKYHNRRVFNVGGFIMLQKSKQDSFTQVFETSTWGMQMTPFL